MYYWTCPRCGSNLDPGEKCDCERERKQKGEDFAKMIKIEAGGQYRLNLAGMGGDRREKTAV